MPGCDIFPPTLYQQKVDRVLKDGVNRSIPGDLTRPQPPVLTPKTAGAVLLGERWGGGADVMSMSSRKSQEVHSEDSVGRVGLGTNVRPSCHSTPWTLNCAKHCSNAVIWTKNIGLSFLLPFFFVNTVATFFLILWHTRMVVRPYQSVHVQNL